MAVLTDEDRKAIFEELEDELSSENVPVTFGRPEGRDAINNVDQWIEDNFVAFNNILPAKVKNSLNTKWKIRLFEKIIDRKWRVA